MDNITPLGKGWKRKGEIAQELRCTKRTITNMVNRGELEKTLIEGTPWFRFPENGTERKGEETGGGNDVSSLNNQSITQRKGAETEAGNEVGNSRKEERKCFPGGRSINFETLYLEEKQKGLELHTEIHLLRSELAEVREESVSFRVLLTEANTALLHVERENSRLQSQNDALQRALKQRTMFQSLLLWLKSFWNKRVR